MNKESKKTFVKIAVSGLLGGSAGAVAFSTLYAIGRQIPSKPAKIVWAVGSYVVGGLVSANGAWTIMEFIDNTENVIKTIKAFQKSNKKRRPNN